MKPIDLIWIHKDMEQFRAGLGVDESQRSSSELSNIKGNLGKRRDSLDRIGIQSREIQRQEINCVLPCDQSIWINWSGSKSLGDDRNRRSEQSVGGVTNWKEVRSRWSTRVRGACIQDNWRSRSSGNRSSGDKCRGDKCRGDRSRWSGRSQSIKGRIGSNERDDSLMGNSRKRLGETVGNIERSNRRQEGHWMVIDRIINWNIQ